MQIDHVEIWTTRLEAQSRFYLEVLCAPLLSKGATSATFEIGTSQLTLHAEAERGEGVYHLAFNVPPDRFEEAREWLKARTRLLCDGAGEDRFLFEAWNAEASYFADSDGNILEIIARRAWIPSRERFPLCCISEVAMAGNHAGDLAQALAQKTGETLYLASPNPLFAPLGTEEGLFICVQSGREWYPNTGIPAVPLPVVVAGRGAAGDFVIDSRTLMAL